MTSETLALSADLYALEAVQEAAEAFGKLAEIAIAPGDSHIEVTFDGARPDVAARLADEFANYALAGTVARFGGAP